MEIEESIPKFILIPYENERNIYLCYFTNSILKGITHKNNALKGITYKNNVLKVITYKNNVIKVITYKITY
jgi:hypothetical protein